MHQTQFSEKIPYGGLSQIRSQICKLRFYYGYTEKDENDEIIRIYYHNAENKYFQLSSCSLYEKELLQDIIHNIVFSACTFESRADVYRANNQLVDQDRLQQYENIKEVLVLSGVHHKESKKLGLCGF